MHEVIHMFTNGGLPGLLYIIVLCCYIPYICWNTEGLIMEKHCYIYLKYISLSCCRGMSTTDVGYLVWNNWYSLLAWITCNNLQTIKVDILAMDWPNFLPMQFSAWWNIRYVLLVPPRAKWRTHRSCGVRGLPLHLLFVLLPLLVPLPLSVPSLYTFDPTLLLTFLGGKEEKE